MIIDVEAYEVEILPLQILIIHLTPNYSQVTSAMMGSENADGMQKQKPLEVYTLVRDSGSVKTCNKV